MMSFTKKHVYEIKPIRMATDKVSAKERAYMLFRPLILLGLLTGIFPLALPRRNRKVQLLARIYSIFIASVILYCIVVTTINMFRIKLALDPNTLTSACMLQYALLCFICQVTTMRSTLNYGEFFDQFKTDSLWENTIPYDEEIKKQLIVAILFVLLKAFGQVAIMTLVVTGVIHLPLPPLIPSVHRSLYLWPVCCFFTQMALSYSKALMGEHCMLVVKHIKRLNEQIEQKITPLHICQRQYQTLVEATRLIDRQFSLFVCLYYAMSLPMICFTLFTLVRASNVGVTFQIIMGYWTISLIFNICAISVPAIRLFEAGLSPLRHLYRVLNDPETSRSPEVTASINTFCQQIATTGLHVSAAGFFTVTRRVMITMLSAIVGYFLLIVQFDMDVREYESDSLTFLSLMNDSVIS